MPAIGHPKAIPVKPPSLRPIVSHSGLRGGSNYTEEEQKSGIHGNQIELHISLEPLNSIRAFSLESLNPLHAKLYA